MVVVKRQWKIVSGGVVAAVTLGGGVALAQGGAKAEEQPTLLDAVGVEEIGVAGADLPAVADTALPRVGADESPFSALSAGQESMSEPSVSEPSEPSESVSVE